MNVIQFSSQSLVKYLKKNRRGTGMKIHSDKIVTYFIYFSVAAQSCNWSKKRQKNLPRISTPNNFKNVLF